ncbi:MAG: twin-arginine translocase TatA/TatE family subunit [Coriobacteriia bacterium]|nr:twin-arginine translocase TatA/TatE family subunit [Coriobacteriia bacterium]MCL2746181.1 twin-arginine translocase TatA/TatE family subunit [Coriobacteriia bacterium]MCL2871043.1 twin-arginine translocase TatA/TatE family subunit [Coriobacteriia bacterium]
MYALGAGWTPGFWEIAIVLAIVLVLFGPKQLPKLARMFKDTTKELRDGMEDTSQPVEGQSAAPVQTAAPAPASEEAPAPAPQTAAPATEEQKAG